MYTRRSSIDFLHNAERPDLNIGRTAAKHSLNCDSIACLDAIPQLCLGGLLLIGPSEKPIPSSDKDLGLIISTAPHSSNYPIVHVYPLWPERGCLTGKVTR